MLGQSPWEAAGTEITVKSPSSSRAGLCWALLATLGPVLAPGGGCTSAPPALRTPPSSVIHQRSGRCLITASAFLFLLIITLPRHLVWYGAAGLELPGWSCRGWSSEGAGSLPVTGSHVLPAAPVGDVSQPQRCPHHGPSAVPGDVLLARLWHIPCVPSHGVQPRCSRRSRVCSWGAPGLCLVQKVRDELRKGRQLQGKEQIPLSHLMLCICVSVGARALARSVALFSLPVAVPDCHSCAVGLVWARLLYIQQQQMSCGP